MGDVFGATAVIPRGHRMDAVRGVVAKQEVKKTPHLSLVKNEVPKKRRDPELRRIVDEFLALKLDD
jgi:hypothetical protein